MLIADTGFWVALLSKRDKHHARASACYTEHRREGFITTWPVITECAWLLASRVQPDAAIAFVDALASGGVQIHDITAPNSRQLAALMHQYISLPMDLADASLVLLAEHLGHGRILSTDMRDFGAYRWKNQPPFTNLMFP